MDERRAALLRTAFLAGAITDAFVVSGYAASLMAAWTGLLLWARQRPLERAFVAPLTVLVIYGLVATEIAAVHAGALSAERMLPTWALQAGLLGLFAGAYHYPALARRLAA